MTDQSTRARLLLIHAGMHESTNGDDTLVPYGVALRAVRDALAFSAQEGGNDTGRETVESMIAWGDETFGPCAPERAVSRAAEEWREMEGEEPGSERHAIEAADVIICLLRIPGIAEAINAKMAKNRTRTWNVMGDGTGYHVGGSGPPTPSDTTGREGVAIPEVAALRAALEMARHTLLGASIGKPVVDYGPTIMAIDTALATDPTRTVDDKTGDMQGLREAGRFLLDRLVDHEVRMTSDDDAREWVGHVTPAMERFRTALNQEPR